MRTQSVMLSLLLCLLTLLIFSSKASAQTWTFCANEGGTCSFSGTQQVRYGANGSYVYKTLTGGTACTNAVFGDPAYGVSKRCDYIDSATTSAGWTFCAYEGATCSFGGTQQVRYGANGSYVYKTLTGGTGCTNAVFGDPAYGVVKRCDYADPTTTSTDWTICANEGGTCNFSGTQQVRYGANGSYAYQTFTGGIWCSNAVFGDPASGVAKQCAIGGTSTSSSVAPAPAPPPTQLTSGYGPQSTITCPAGAVDIWPGQYIPGIGRYR